MLSFPSLPNLFHVIIRLQDRVSPNSLASLNNSWAIATSRSPADQSFHLNSSDTSAANTKLRLIAYSCMVLATTKTTTIKPQNQTTSSQQPTTGSTDSENTQYKIRLRIGERINKRFDSLGMNTWWVYLACACAPRYTYACTNTMWVGCSFSTEITMEEFWAEK